LGNSEDYRYCGSIIQIARLGKQPSSRQQIL
jgi:hypothetical protein